MKRPIIFIFLILTNFLLIVPTFSAGVVYAKTADKSQNLEVDISAKAGLLLDYQTGKVLFDKNSNERLPIASMTKLATLAIVFDAISKGAIKENDMVQVSQTAAKVGGSSAYLDAGSSYKVSELIKSIIIASANDSSVAMAEYVAGSEELFVSRMNKFASSLNLKNTNFKNCTGLPKTDHYSSARDIAEIYKTICNNAIYKKYSKIWMDDFLHPSGRKTGLVNTNKLIKTYEGIEGGKTGYTDAAKFCLTASANRGNLRLVGVIVGAPDSKTRFAEMSKLFNYGFANFDSKQMANIEVPVAIAPVEKSEKKIEVYPESNLSILINKNDGKTYTSDFKIDELKAPIKSGDVVGKLFVFDENNMVIDEVNLISKTDVAELSFKERLKKLVAVW